MKTSIRNLYSIALCAAFATTTAHAGTTRVVTQGRAGYTVIPAPKSNTAARTYRPETTVALAIGKPDRPPTQLQTMGRAGYRMVPARSQNR